MGLDFVAQGEVGAGVACLGVGELVAERGEGAGATWGGERVDADEQPAEAGLGGGGLLVRVRDQSAWVVGVAAQLSRAWS